MINEPASKRIFKNETGRRMDWRLKRRRLRKINFTNRKRNLRSFSLVFSIDPYSVIEPSLVSNSVFISSLFILLQMNQHSPPTRFGIFLFVLFCFYFKNDEKRTIVYIRIYTSGRIQSELESTCFPRSRLDIVVGWYSSMVCFRWMVSVADNEG